MGSYTCTCATGFTGKNCEKRQLTLEQQHALLLVTTNNSSSTPSFKSVAQHHQNPQKQANTPLASTKKNQQAQFPNQHPTVTSQTTQQSGLNANHPSQSMNHGTPSFMHPFSQQMFQHQPTPFDNRTMTAVGLFIVCSVILVVLLLFKRLERTTQRQWNQENNHVEDVATIQNHQNIYKSRTSLSTDKVPFGDTVDSASSSGASSSSSLTPTTLPENLRRQNNRHRHHHDHHGGRSRRIYGGSQHYYSHHDIHVPQATTTTGPLNPPPPYTLSQSHPNSTYNNSTYNNSIYYPHHNPSANHTNGSIYTTGSTNFPYGQTLTSTAAASNPYLNSASSTYQSPYFVIYLPNPAAAAATAASSSTETTATTTAPAMTNPPLPSKKSRSGP